MSKSSEVRIQLLGGLIPSNIEVFCLQKPSGDASDSDFSFVPKRWKMGQCYGLERNYRAQNNVKGLGSSLPAARWPYSKQYWSFLPAKVEQWCPRLDLLVSSQNVKKGASATTSKETTQLITTSKVSEDRIKRPGGLIPTNIEVFSPQKPSDDAPDSIF